MDASLAHFDAFRRYLDENEIRYREHRDHGILQCGWSLETFTVEVFFDLPEGPGALLILASLSVLASPQVRDATIAFLNRISAVSRVVGWTADPDDGEIRAVVRSMVGREPWEPELIGAALGMLLHNVDDVSPHLLRVLAGADPAHEAAAFLKSRQRDDEPDTP